MKIKFHPYAESEIDEAVKWYDEQVEGLGGRFVKTLDENILRIARYPRFNTEVSKGIYRSLVKCFPYCIYYEIGKDDIIIYAIAHMHRKPSYWKTRMG